MSDGHGWPTLWPYNILTWPYPWEAVAIVFQDQLKEIYTGPPMPLNNEQQIDVDPTTDLEGKPRQPIVITRMLGVPSGPVVVRELCGEQYVGDCVTSQDFYITVDELDALKAERDQLKARIRELQERLTGEQANHTASLQRISDFAKERDQLKALIGLRELDAANLSRERDEARKADEQSRHLLGEARKERDEARAEVEIWRQEAMTWKAQIADSLQLNPMQVAIQLGRELLKSGGKITIETPK